RKTRWKAAGEAWSAPPDRLGTMTSTDPIFSVALGAMMVLAAMIAGVALRRALRARHIQQQRVVERPDPGAAAAANADQQRRQRWKSIDLQAIHEVNRAEVSRLL